MKAVCRFLMITGGLWLALHIGRVLVIIGVVILALIIVEYTSRS